MAANTTIEWATKSWNPVRGCSRVSPGCDECYAMKFAHRFSGAGKPYEGLTTIRKGKVDWSGVARFIPKELDAPLRWRKPERIFVNSMSDLFHSSLSFEQVAAVFGVMAAASRHQFLVLTKRPERALEFFNWVTHDRGFDHMQAGKLHVSLCDAMQGQGDWDPGDEHCEDLISNANDWPLSNVWLGVSVENQETADERIPLLLKCPAAIRWISAEPLLGPLSLLNIEIPSDSPMLDWVVIGGESGPGARPFHVSWARSIVRLCEVAGIACFVKQLGSRPFRAALEDETAWGETVRGREFDAFDEPGEVRLDDRKGGTMTEWPVDLRVREFPEVQA